MKIDGETLTRVPSALETIGLGGLAIGVLDMLDALVFFGWYLGLGVQPVFHGVAAGILGRDAAVSGGWSTWWLGLFLHFVNAFIIAAIYYIASSYLTILIRHPVVFGLVYGIIVHFGMQLVVIPLSAIGRMPAFSMRTTLNGVIGHALLVGLPVALIASWSASRRKS